MQVAAALTARRCVQTLPGNPMRAFTTLTLLASLCACQSYVAVPVQPVTLVAVSQRNKVRVFTKADVLLVIDDSPSMSGKQERLAAALQNFTAQLDALNPPVDYQVSVTTTTVSERLGACGPAGDPNAANACESEWEANGFSCDQGLACFRSFPQAGQLNRPVGAPGPILRRSDYTAQQFASLLATDVEVGVAGSRQPQGMEAMKLALQRPGFLRNASMGRRPESSSATMRSRSESSRHRTARRLDECRSTMLRWTGAFGGLRATSTPKRPMSSSSR